MSNPNAYKNGISTQFSSTKQPKNNGRKPSKLRKYIKETNLSSLDIALVFENIIAKKDTEVITKMIKTKRDENGKPLPVLVWGFLIAFVADCKRGLSGGGIVSLMMDRKYGKTKDVIEHTGGLDITVLNAEERQAMLNDLMEKRRKHQEAIKKLEGESD
jgi:hypothetical protein